MADARDQGTPERSDGGGPMPSLGGRAGVSLLYYIFIFGSIYLLDSALFGGSPSPQMPYSEFLDRIDAGKVQSVVLTDEKIYGLLRDESKPKSDETKAPHTPPVKKAPWHFDIVGWFKGVESRIEASEAAAEAEAKLHFVVTPVTDSTLVDRLHKHGVEFSRRIETHYLRNLLSNWILPFAILFIVWGFVMKRMSGAGIGGPLQMGQSKAKVYEASAEEKVHFKDVAGVDEAVEETREIVEFLKEPDRFTRLGAKLPKGVLLVGPPGTGKTLLARAVAGESGVPFFSLSGSDFVEMFVGVGASRVRDLFRAAKERAPCIIFVDELDAIGRARGGAQSPVGGFDERENTLNQLLVELDGFDAHSAVVLMGATNRPEVLDPALLRPGRFDRQILVGRPHRDGRRAIFEVHAAELPLAADVDFDRLAGETAGMVGADIANLCNEAALLASRRDVDEVAMTDFQDALERVIGGLERKGRVMNEAERRRVAYHESGHTLVGYFTPGADPVQKVSIVPRGQGALGYTLQAPLEDRFLMSRSEVLGRVRTLLGGRAAEELVFGDISTGASDDLDKASRIIRDMLTVYGMSQEMPNLSLGAGQPDFLGNRSGSGEHSAEIERRLGEEQLAILESGYAEAKALLEAHRDQLEALATRLLEREKIDQTDLAELLGPRPSDAA